MFSKLFSKWVLCRGCLKPMSGVGEAGLCAFCWEGLWPLPEKRCPKCALLHGENSLCPDKVAWECGDSLWNYRGGRPPFGSLLITGIKSGETGWRRALLKRIATTGLPPWAGDVDLVTSAPPSPIQKIRRGFDLAEEAAKIISFRLSLSYAHTLNKSWFSRRQAKQTESQRRRMPQKNFYVHNSQILAKKTILLIDDVWTTGTTLLRCTEVLKKFGAKEVRVLTLFRAV
ncbi:MAG: hypothetical protein FWG12_01015 [Holophagaceae bacterium]|nr:hypothetical protein [Holophagaceae bacterium]